MFRSFEVDFKERMIIGHVDGDEETKYVFIHVPLTVMSKAVKAIDLDAFYNNVLSEQMHLIARTGKARAEFKLAQGGGLIG